MKQLEGKKAIVTGASRGIGKHIAIEYARQGADVALIARSEDLLNEVAAEVVDLGRNAVVKVADVTDEAAITAAVQGGIEDLGRPSGARGAGIAAGRRGALGRAGRGGRDSARGTLESTT